MLASGQVCALVSHYKPLWSLHFFPEGRFLLQLISMSALGENSQTCPFRYLPTDCRRIRFNRCRSEVLFGPLNYRLWFYPRETISCCRNLQGHWFGSF